MQAEIQRLISAGELSAARDILVGEVRANPELPWPRWLLFELHLVNGSWDPALAHLSALRSCDPARLPTYEAYALVIEALRAREAVWRGERMPKCHDTSWLVWERRMELLRKVSANDLSSAARLGDLALSAPALQGHCDGVAFATWADRDVRFKFGIEAIIAGDYWWLPWAELRRVELAGTGQRLRDLVVRPVTLTLVGKDPGPAFLPVRYPESEQTSDAALLLGRETRVRETPSCALCLGTHLFRAGTEPAQDFPLTSFRTLDLVSAPAP